MVADRQAHSHRTAHPHPTALPRQERDERTEQPDTLPRAREVDRQVVSSPGWDLSIKSVSPGRGREVGSVAPAVARQRPQGGQEEVVAPTVVTAVSTSAGRDREGRG